MQAFAVGTDDADLAGGHTDLGVVAFLSHQLGIGAAERTSWGACRGASRCCGSRYHGDVGDGQAVAGLDIGAGRGKNLIAHIQAVGSQNVAQGAVLVLDQRDESGSGWDRTRCAAR